MKTKDHRIVRVHVPEVRTAFRHRITISNHRHRETTIDLQEIIVSMTAGIIVIDRIIFTTTEMIIVVVAVVGTG